MATVLICSLALPASAEVIQNDGVYGGCGYSTYANCGTDRFNAFIQYMYSTSGSYTDYLLQTSVEYTFTTTWWGGTQTLTENSIASTRISSVYKEVNNMERIECTYRINTQEVRTVEAEAG